MFIIIGIVIVLGCVIGGFLMINGPLGTLVQPAEYVVIGGAAFGAMVAANPLKLLLHLPKVLMAALKGSPYNKNAYIEILRMQYDIFINSKKGGMLSIEEDVNTPAASAILRNIRHSFPIIMLLIFSAML